MSAGPCIVQIVNRVKTCIFDLTQICHHKPRNHCTLKCLIFAVGVKYINQNLDEWLLAHNKLTQQVEAISSNAAELQIYQCIRIHPEGT